MNRAKVEAVLAQLRQWHEHNAAECRREGEEEARAFHLEAAEALKEILSA
jgi:hypothetical protein